MQRIAGRKLTPKITLMLLLLFTDTATTNELPAVPVVSPGLAVRSDSARSRNGNGTVGLVLVRERDEPKVPYALTNFHVVYRKGAMRWQCPFVKHQTRPSASPLIFGETDNVKIGVRTRQAYYPSKDSVGTPAQFGMCFTRKKNRGPDAALIKLEPNIRWSNQILGCERLVITGVEDAREGMLVAKSGKRTGLTFGVIEEIKTTTSGYRNVKIRPLHQNDLRNGIYANRGATTVRHDSFNTKGSRDCDERAVSCGGDSGSIWFAWPGADAQTSNFGVIEVNAVALHHKGDGVKESIAASMSDLMEIYEDLVVPPLDRDLLTMRSETATRRYAGSIQDSKKWCEYRGLLER